MTKISWQIYHAGTVITDISSKVISIDMTAGRQKYLDPYSGGQIQITINNASDFASTIKYGDQLQLISTINGDSIYENGNDLLFFVEETTFNDYPGSTGFNTATITGVDAFARVGRANVFSKSIGQTTTSYQANLLSGAGGSGQSGVAIDSPSLAGSTASAITYTGTLLNYLNYLQTTEHGIMALTGAKILFVPRQTISQWSVGSYTVGRTTSSTQVAYQNILRIQNGTQFINSATISSAGLTDQTYVNQTSINTYGYAYYSATSVDQNTTQALGNAQWIANSFADPASLRYQITVSDWTQNNTAMLGWLRQLFRGITTSGNPFYLTKLYYTPPGGSSTAVDVVVEGYSTHVDPDGTTYTFDLSPLQYYQFFTLNSSTLGILNTSRLGW